MLTAKFIYQDVEYEVTGRHYPSSSSGLEWFEVDEIKINGSNVSDAEYERLTDNDDWYAAASEALDSSRRKRNNP